MNDSTRSQANENVYRVQFNSTFSSSTENEHDDSILFDIQFDYNMA